MELAEQLKQDGIAKGLCRQYQMKLKPGMPVGDMVKLFIHGIDFCVKNDYPTLEFMREHFKGESEPYGAFIDDVVTGLKNAPDTVLNGECKAMLEYNGYSVSRVYIRHQSKVSVSVSGNAIVTIDVFDNSYLAVAVAGTDAKVIVNQYGDSSKVECFGNGITHNLINKKTY